MYKVGLFATPFEPSAVAFTAFHPVQHLARHEVLEEARQLIKVLH